MPLSNPFGRSAARSVTRPRAFVACLALALACGPDAAPPAEAPPATPASSAPSASQAAPEAAPPPSPQAAMAARPLAITRHGACRMDCRRIDRGEVEAVLRGGALDPARTRTDGPCPSHALEGRGTDGHRLRVVFAACPDETRVVTAIDLDRDWPCACG